MITYFSRKKAARLLPVAVSVPQLSQVMSGGWRKRYPIAGFGRTKSARIRPVCNWARADSAPENGSHNKEVETRSRSPDRKAPPRSRAICARTRSWTHDLPRLGRRAAPAQPEDAEEIENAGAETSKESI